MKRDYLAAMAISLLTRIIVGVVARWVDCGPVKRQRIYFANHSSHLDAVVLWSTLPADVRSKVRPVAAKDYWQSSGIRRYLAVNVFNSVLIARPDKLEKSDEADGSKVAMKAIDDMVDAMGSEYSLILFPEGTRGSGVTTGSFKGGLYHLARRKPDVELVPVYMENLSRIFPKGEYLPVPLISSISFGSPIRIEEKETKKDFLVRAREAVEALSRV